MPERAELPREEGDVRREGQEGEQGKNKEEGQMAVEDTTGARAAREAEDPRREAFGSLASTGKHSGVGEEEEACREASGPEPD